MTPQDKLLWSAWLQLHGVGQDLLDEIDCLEAENADLKNQITIFEYNETNFVKLLQETNPELEALRLRAVPDWGEGVAMGMTDSKWEIRIVSRPRGWIWVLSAGTVLLAERYYAGQDKKNAQEDARHFIEAIGSKWPIEIKE